MDPSKRTKEALLGKLARVVCSLSWEDGGEYGAESARRERTKRSSWPCADALPGLDIFLLSLWR